MTNPFDADNTHSSDLDLDLLIDQYGGEVDSQFAKSSMMREFVKVRSVIGTDTIVNDRVGRTTLQALKAGVRPDATPTPFGKVSLTIDTVILARDNRSLLRDLQTHFDARMELAQDHGKQLAKLFDEAFLIQNVKGAGLGAPSGSYEDGSVSVGLNGAFGAGKSITLGAAGDELDPDKLEAAIHDIVTEMLEADIDVNEIVVFVRPKTYQVLLNNDKLVHKDYSTGNGEFANAKIDTIAGARIVMTARLANAPITGHLLSTAANGNAYDVTAEEARCVATIMHPKSLFAGETIPMTSKIWFSDEEKQWFIDSWMSFAVTVNRADVCGRVLKHA